MDERRGAYCSFCENLAYYMNKNLPTADRRRKKVLIIRAVAKHTAKYVKYVAADA
jgi:hypothetical protein